MYNINSIIVGNTKYFLVNINGCVVSIPEEEFNKDLLDELLDR